MAEKCATDLETCSGFKANNTSVPATSASSTESPRTIDPQEGASAGATGKCTDADKTKFREGGGVSGFDDIQTKCGNQCGAEALKGPACVTACVQKGGYSDGCASCAGESASCVIKNCLADCIADSKGAACRSCSNSKCAPAFNACSGLLASDVQQPSASSNAAPAEPTFYPITGAGAISFVNSVSQAWNGGSKALAVVIVIFSGIWPYLKIILMGVAWFKPMAQATRHSLLVWITRLGRWSLVDVYAVVVLLIALNFDLYGGAVQVKAEARPAISTFAVAACISLSQSEFMIVRHLSISTFAITSVKEREKERFFTSPVVLVAVGLIALSFTIAAVAGPWIALTLRDAGVESIAPEPQFYTLATLLTAQSDYVIFVCVVGIILAVVIPLFVSITGIGLGVRIAQDCTSDQQLTSATKSLLVSLSVQSALGAFCCLDVLFLATFIILHEYPALIKSTTAALSPCSKFVVTADMGWGAFLIIPASLFLWWLIWGLGVWQERAFAGAKKEKASVQTPEYATVQTNDVENLEMASV